VQVPPLEPPPVQSHSGGGQVPPEGQASGVTQLHAPPPLVGWQNPPLAQLAPSGQSVPACDQAQPDFALQVVASLIERQGSG
jgi:hypothetical protein